MPSAPADFQHLVGTSIDDGRYLFLRILGVGAFGVVVLAQDLHEADDSFVGQSLSWFRVAWLRLDLC